MSSWFQNDSTETQEMSGQIGSTVLEETRKSQEYSEISKEARHTTICKEPGQGPQFPEDVIYILLSVYKPLDRLSFRQLSE